ncbi:MAG: cation transporter [Candidatus Tectomicrobia bacterium]|uniref:Cation transporter n=1 Tax=Tectimicrobiota bacterium TaxID=2528274 RepID=A0A932GR00_UNCTE|nr:cation transporter [Candidatus Tectomicrobia bacterium]
MQRALEELGIREIDVDLKTGSVRGRYDPGQITFEDLDKAIRRRVILKNLRHLLGRLAHAVKTVGR